MEPVFTLARRRLRQLTDDELWALWDGMVSWPLRVGWMERKAKACTAELVRRGILRPLDKEQPE